MNSLKSIVKDKITIIEDYELEAIYHLLLAGRRLVGADIARSVGIWLWDEMQQYQDRDIKKSFSKAHAKLIEMYLKNYTAECERYHVISNAWGIYTMTDQCINEKKLMHVAKKQS